jgi:hypothetical protein
MVGQAAAPQRRLGAIGAAAGARRAGAVVDFAGHAQFIGRSRGFLKKWRPARRDRRPGRFARA